MLAPTKTRRPHHIDLDPRSQRAAPGCVDHERFVFSDDPDGAEPWRPNRVTKRFIALRTTAGVGHVRLHDLRHLMATEMLHRLVPLPTVSGRLAHARMSTTLNVYAHAVPNGDRQAATVIGDLVAGAPTRRPGATPLRPRTTRHARGPTRWTSRCRARPSGRTRAWPSFTPHRAVPLRRLASACG